MTENLDIPQIKLDEAGQLDMKTSSPEPESFTQIKPQTTDEGNTMLEQKPQTTKPRRKLLTKKNKKILAGVGGVILLIVLLIVAIGVLPAMEIYNNAKVIQAQVPKIQSAVDAQDIGKVKAELVTLKSNITTLQGSFKRLSWTAALPIAGKYWVDGDAGIKAGLLGIDAGLLTIDAVEPYADIIGFTGDPSKQAKSGEESANDRIEFLIQTIESIAPKADEIAEKAKLAKAELDKIDPNDYPEEFRGMKVREKLKKGLSLAEQGTAMISQSKPLLQAAPYFLGNDSPRTYLLLFQNDKELRPTGGFITAYSIMRVSKGKLQPVSSSDIYSLDAKYKPWVVAPDPFVTFLKGPYLLSKTMFLRDMNWSPDFEESMNLFSEEAKKAGIDQIDGIIAVDTQVLVNILEVLGRIGVPGFGNFSTEKDPRCDCPQVIYELESFADVEGPVVWSENEPGKIVFAPKNYGKNRKEIVGPLMNSILSNALGQPKDKLPQLIQAGWDSVMEKHILIYMFDDKYQQAVKDFNLAGKINEAPQDYLHVNNANLGGRKSNLYVTNEVNQEIKVQKDGSIEKTVTITYKNPKAQDGWLNSVLPNWTRVYVPKGSQLLSTEGFEEKQDPYEELGKTVFAGGFKLRPQGVAKVTLRYKLPFKANQEMKMLIQKQPGDDMPLYTITVGKQKEELFLKTDQEFKFRV